MINLKRFLCLVAVVCVAITCLMLLSYSSFRQYGVTTLCSELSRNNNTGDGAVMDVMRLLHGNVEKVLIDGQLPVDPRENKSWSLWDSDPPGSPCFEYKTRFGMHLPPVWLASYPCSGNTWTRYLLEAASGVFTGSIYKDTSLTKKGYLGERDSVTTMRTLVQKIHTIPPCKLKDRKCPENNRTIPTVLLLRNPANNIKLWRQLALDRLLWTEAPLYVMHYEHLVQEPLKELTALLAFLGVPSDEGRMACIPSHLDGSFKRKGNAALDPYSAEEKAEMAVETGAVNRTLLMMGYSPLPTYHKVQTPEHK